VNNTNPDIETKVIRELGILGISYELIQCDPQFADTAIFCEKYGYSLDECGNTILVASKKEPRQYAACVVRASMKIDVNKTVRKLMGIRRLSFASADETMKRTGMLIGGVTVFALPSDISLYVDSRLMELRTVILGSGSRSSKVNISPSVFKGMPNARIIEGLSI
jgi:prolyl-tRNA editing enzyme YbaK/EbsC (Cys-tRNA(Pro) deacylase)